MDKERYIKVNEIHKKARYFRGRFLNSVACVEHDIAEILTEYFCTEDKDKQELFFSKVLGKLSLQKKKEVLEDIVKNDYHRHWEEFKHIFKDLQSIQEFRNKLAHSIVDVSTEALERPIEEGIGFVQWAKGEPITESKFEDWDVKTNMVASTLTSIKRLLPFKDKPIEQ